MEEKELYGPMRLWLDQYLRDKYKRAEVITETTSETALENALEKHSVECSEAVGLKIQIDVLGIVKDKKKIRLFFIEAKKGRLTIRDLGQLWAYCRLIDPEEAFLLTSGDLGGLYKMINVFHREDLLSYGDGKHIKRMKIGRWDVTKGCIDQNSLIPKM